MGTTPRGPINGPRGGPLNVGVKLFLGSVHPREVINGAWVGGWGIDAIRQPTFIKNLEGPLFHSL